MQGLHSNSARFWATKKAGLRQPLLILFPFVGDPRKCTAAHSWPIRGLLLLSPAVKRLGPPRRQGLCSHPAHLWAYSDFVPRSEALGSPRRQG